MWWCCSWGLREVIGFRWGHEGGTAWWNQCPYKRRKRPELALSPPWEGTARRRPSANQEEGPLQSPATLTSWSQTCSHQTAELNVCCLSHSIDGILLWQPELTQREMLGWVNLSGERSGNFNLWELFKEQRKKWEHWTGAGASGLGLFKYIGLLEKDAV